MEANQRNSPKRLKQLDRVKNNHFQAEMKRVFQAFKAEPKTMLQVSFETGILRSNIFRFVAKWRRQGKIKVVRLGLCPITKHRAGYYATDTNLLTQPLKLF